MTLNKNQWFVKWFTLSCMLIDNFCLTRNGRYFGSRKEKYMSGTNLCHFFQTMFWGLLISVLVLAVYCYGIYVCLILPFIAYSSESILTVFLYIIGGISVIAGCLAILVGVIWCIDKINIPLFTPKIKVEKKPGFFACVFAYAKAAKQRICPLISFQSETTQESATND